MDGRLRKCFRFDSSRGSSLIFQHTPKTKIIWNIFSLAFSTFCFPLWCRQRQKKTVIQVRTIRSPELIQFDQEVGKLAGGRVIWDRATMILVKAIHGELLKNDWADAIYAPSWALQVGACEMKMNGKLKTAEREWMKSGGQSSNEISRARGRNVCRVEPLVECDSTLSFCVCLTKLEGDLSRGERKFIEKEQRKQKTRPTR